MIKIVVVEDNKTIREGLKLLIDSSDGFSCLAAFSSSEVMLENIQKLNPDVLLIDLILPQMNGIDGTRLVKKLMPNLVVIALTIYEENEMIFDAICAGASGYIVKKTPPEKMLDAIKDAFEGGTPMSSLIARKVVDYFQQKKNPNSDKNYSGLNENEKSILQGLIEGYSFKTIADSLSLTQNDVKGSLKSIYKKIHDLADLKVTENEV